MLRPFTPAMCSQLGRRITRRPNGNLQEDRKKTQVVTGISLRQPSNNRRFDLGRDDILTRIILFLVATRLLKFHSRKRWKIDWAVWLETFIIWLQFPVRIREPLLPLTDDRPTIISSVHGTPKHNRRSWCLGPVNDVCNTLNHKWVAYNIIVNRSFAYDSQ